MHPQPVCIGSKHTVVTTVTPEITRHSLRNGFNGFLRALPGDEFLFVTVTSGSRLVKTRSGRRISAGLTSATDARTTRLRRTQRPHQLPRQAMCRLPKFWRSVEAPFVRAPFDRSRADKTRPAITSHAQRCRVHRIPPRVRDDRDTPLWGVGRNRVYCCFYFCVKREWGISGEGNYEPLHSMRLAAGLSSYRTLSSFGSTRIKNSSSKRLPPEK
jgi:hypothetical protein